MAHCEHFAVYVTQGEVRHSNHRPAGKITRTAAREFARRRMRMATTYIRGDGHANILGDVRCDDCAARPR